MNLLVVGTGSRGGIGRYEQLLRSAFDELARRGDLEWRGIWRGESPSYLGQSQARSGFGSGSRAGIVAALVGATRTWTPDLVYFTHVNLARLAPLLPMVGIRSPYVVATLGVEVWEQLHWAKQSALRRAAAVLAISEYTRSRVVALHGVDDARCKTVHLALEDHWLLAADRLLGHGRVRHLPASDGHSLLSVCRLERAARDKGVDWVLIALASLTDTYPGLRYTVVGDGDDLPYLRTLAADLGLTRRVTFCGALDHSELLLAYRDCDVFVLPTRREGFGLVFLEAMAFRKPIIAMACAGTLDVVTPGEQGLLIDAQADLRGAIEALILDPNLVGRMGAAGRSAVSGRFSFDAFVARLWSSILRDHAPT